MIDTDDCISRRAVLALAKDIYVPMGNGEVYRTRSIDPQEVRELPPVQPELHWIPCSKRLPNHDEYIKNNGLFIVSNGNRSYSEWYDIYDKRRFGEHTMSGFCIDYAVTAWMPLPEPYKGGVTE